MNRAVPDIFKLEPRYNHVQQTKTKNNQRENRSHMFGLLPSIINILAGYTVPKRKLSPPCSVALAHECRTARSKASERMLLRWQTAVVH